MTAKIGYVQYEVQYGDWAANATIVRRMIAEGADADLLVLPELGMTGYDFVDPVNLAGTAEPFRGGPTSALMVELAAEHGVTLVMGYPEQATEGVYNSCLMALPDGTLHNYRKLHLFNRETEIFLPGDEAPQVYDTPAGRIGMMICFDWYFPEVARCLGLRGAQVIAHPSNLILPWCQRAMFARSIENRVFIVTANRIGTETQAGRSLTFTGKSQVMSALGEVVAEAPVDAPDVSWAEVDVATTDEKTVAGYNDLFRDRRMDVLGPILSAEGALS